MELHLSPFFDAIVYAPPASSRAGVLYAGEKKLLSCLETQFGSSGFPANTDYLRIEFYRQAIAEYLQEYPDSIPFFKASYAADRFACAAVLLGRRDELRLAGWRFETATSTPRRLKELAGIEIKFKQKSGDPEYWARVAGFADRFEAALERAKNRKPEIDQLCLHLPEDLLPPHLRRFVALCRAWRIPIHIVERQVCAPEGMRLNALQNRLLQNEGLKSQKDQAPADDSLLILKSRRDSDLAAWFADILRENKALQPLIIAPEASLMFEQNLLTEGFAAMGMLSTSTARPALQVLKLAPAFLWEPVDVFKFMEFVTLPVKPLEGGLALEIARVLAQKPGLFSDNWFGAIFSYLERAETSDEARSQYEFWFERRRYKMDATAPIRDAIAIYDYLYQWALRQQESGATSSATFPVLAEQARRIRDLLSAMPDQRIGFLELERIVRTVYEAAPIQTHHAEVGRFEFIHHPGAIAAYPAQSVWWNCIYNDSTPAPEFWRAEERAYLSDKQILLDEVHRESQRKRYGKLQTVLHTQKQLILLVPEQADGLETIKNTLIGEIEALFPDYPALFFDLEAPEDRARLERLLKLPEWSDLNTRLPGRTRPQLAFSTADTASTAPYQTPTGIEQLLYYPHRWFFKDQLRLYASNILSISKENTLLGTLAHRFFEDLLREPGLETLSKNAVFEWVETSASKLLEKEGATLLLYGREPERNILLTRVKNAAWSLLSMLKNNGWQVLETEKVLEGHFAGIPVRGQADLVLQRAEERAIVDLKWGGANRRKTLIRNGEDLQLILYAHLLPPPESWPHTAYFIIEDGKMIARNGQAFREAILAGSPDADHASEAAHILEKMQKTFAWRLDQLQKGKLELRTACTASELEAIYEGQLFELLEMKREDAPWDEFKTLLAYM